MLTLRTFGLLRLEGVPDATDVDVRSVKALLLLAYLVVEQGRPVERAALADLLWGEQRPDTARGSLRQALHALRRVLGPEALPSDRQAVALRVGVIESDIDALAAASQANDAEAFVRWYTGPFCAHVDTEGLEALASWVGVVRQRWRERLLLIVPRQIESYVAAGRLDEAAQLAERLLRAEPTLPKAVSVGADAYVAAGRYLDARTILERARDRAREDGVPIPVEIVARLARVDGALGAREVVADGLGPSWPERGCFGREEELGRVLALAEQARFGTCTHALVVGPPGIGKTRLMDECARRLGARGWRVGHVRYLPAMESSMWSGVRELARTLATLPGAIGVSGASARVLVAGLPELRDVFPGVAPPPGFEVEPGQWVRALADVINAVSDERPLALFEDNFHWMDPSSADVVAELWRSVPNRVFSLQTSRRDVPRHLPGEVRLPLGPLSLDAIRDLVAAMFGAGDDAAMTEVARILERLSAGVPQLLREECHRLLGSAQFHRDGGRGILSAVEGGSDYGGQSSALDRRIESLSESERLTGRVIALWQRPLADRDLLGVLRALDDRQADTVWRAAMNALEQSGLISWRHDAWAIAHDLVADCLLSGISDRDIEALLTALAGRATPQGVLALPHLDHVALLAGRYECRIAAERLVRESSRSDALRRLGVRGPALARRVASAAGRPEWEAPLLDALGFLQRRSPRVQAAIAALASATGVLCIWALWMLQPRLVVEVVPIAGPAFEGGDGRPALGFYVQPRVGVYDGFGRRLERVDASIRVDGSSGSLISDGARRLSKGQAQFASVTIVDPFRGMQDPDLWTLRFSGPWWMRSVRVKPLGQLRPDADRFTLRSVVVGRDTVPLDGIARVSVGGDSIEVTVTFEFTAGNPTANYVVGAAPTWVAPERGTIRLAGLPRPVAGAWQTVSFRVPAPERPGRAAIVFAMDTEGSAEHLFSQTNWTTGEPVWGDGNDLAALPEGALDTLRTIGLVESRGLLVAPYRVRLGSLVRGQPTGSPRGWRQQYAAKQVLGAVVYLEAR